MKTIILVMTLLCSGCTGIRYCEGRYIDATTVLRKLDIDKVTMEPNYAEIEQYKSESDIPPELLAFLASEPLAGAMSYGCIECEVVRVYDGDTFYCNVAGWPPIVGEKIGIRINGIDTPEMRGKSDKEKRLAKEAKELVQNILLNAQKVELCNMQRGKYFRIVADVYADDVCIKDMLSIAGLAVPYDGGTKTKDWSR